MAIDITNKEEKQIALTGAEIESALLKANDIQSSASEIDVVVKDGEFGEVTIKVDTIPTTEMLANDAAVDIHHQAKQGISSVNPAIVVHNYTDSKAMQLDNVGSGDIIRLKNAYNPNKRLDKDTSFVGTGNYIVLESSTVVEGVEVNEQFFKILNNGEFVFQKTGSAFKFINNNTNNPLIEAFKFSSNSATRIVNFDNKVIYWDEGSTLTHKLSKDTIYQLGGVNIIRLYNNKAYFYVNIHLAKGITDKNGSTGTAGQVLTALGDGTCVWQTPA